jgi:hypothetical protein
MVRFLIRGPSGTVVDSTVLRGVTLEAYGTYVKYSTVLVSGKTIHDWQRLGEGAYIDHGGDVKFGFVSLEIGGEEYSRKYVETHSAEIAALLENERVRENLEEIG